MAPINWPIAVTPLGAALVELQREVFAKLDELAHHAPADADRVVGAIVSHLRAWRPESVSPLGVLPPPTEPVCDPRRR
jgi:hypothetical protein